MKVYLLYKTDSDHEQTLLAVFRKLVTVQKVKQGMEALGHVDQWGVPYCYEFEVETVEER